MKTINNSQGRKSKLYQEADKNTTNLNNLCKKTPEGFMITIEQSRFDGRDPANFMPGPTSNPKFDGLAPM